MKTSAILNAYLPAAPVTPCSHYDANDTVLCIAKGRAKNKFPLKCAVASIALETDNESYRFPPDKRKEVCDWCVFTEEGHRGCFVELKGSDFGHALQQLDSTMSYMHRQYQIVPQRAIVVLSGAHPTNARPGKANAKEKFNRKFRMTCRQFVLCERSQGIARADDILT